MKKLLIILLIFSAFATKAQTIQYLGSPTTQIYVRGQLRIDTVVYLPLRDTTFTPSQKGAFIVKNITPYLWTGVKWVQMAVGSPVWGTLSGTLSDQIDLQNALNAKQNTISAGYGIKIATNTILFDSATVRKVDTITRLNDSTLNFTINGVSHSVLLRGTPAGGISSLVLNVPGTPFIDPVTFSNSSGAWSSSMVLAQQNANSIWSGPPTGSPAQPTFRSLTTTDLPLGIPNANLQNSTITYAGSATGSDISITPTTVSLGGTVTVVIPSAGPAARGALTAADWITFNNKPISVNGQSGVVITKNADSITSLPVDTSTNRNNYLLTFDSTNHKWKLTAGATAGVTSVALTAPSFLNVAGSPITSSGTFALSLVNQTQNKVFASPDGSTGVPTFRAVVNADLPASGVTPGTYNSVTFNAQGIATAASNVGSGITTLNGLTGATQLFATGTSGSDFNIASSSTTHTFNIPTADASHRGLTSSSDWSIFNNKQPQLTGNGYAKFATTTASFLTPAQVTADLNLFTPSLQGLAPASGGGTANFLRADGVYAIPTRPFFYILDYSAGHTGDSVTDFADYIDSAIAHMPKLTYQQRGTLYFPAGAFYISRPIHIPSYVNIFGVGTTMPITGSGQSYGDSVVGTYGGTVIITRGSYDAFILDTTGSGFKRSFSNKIADMSFTCDAPSNPTAGAAIHFINAILTLVDNVSVTRFYDDVKVDAGFQYSFRHCGFYNFVHSGMTIGNNIEVDAGDFVLDDIIFSTNGFIGATYPKGIIYLGGGGFKGTNLKFNGSFPSAGAGKRIVYPIYVDMIQGQTSDFLLTNCSIENYDTTAVYINGHGTFANIIINGIQTAGGAAVGSVININNCNTVTINGFAFGNNGTTVSAYPMIQFNSVNNATVGKGQQNGNYTASPLIGGTGGSLINVDYMWSQQVKVGNVNAVTNSAFYSEFSDLTGLGTNSVTLKNSNATQATTGIQYNLAYLNMYSGNGTVRGVLGTTYATSSGGTAPYNFSGLAIGAVTNHQINFFTNALPRMIISNAGSLQLNTYGLGTHTGTAAYGIYTDASGNIIETNTLPNGTAATTQTAGDNTTKVATTAFVTAAAAGVKLAYTAVGATQAVNTSAETSIAGVGSGSLAIGANVLTAGKSYRFKISGIYNTTTIPGNVTFKIKVGSVVIGTGTISNLINSASNLAWSCTGTIVCWTTGSSGSAITDAVLNYSTGNLLPANALELDNSGVVSTINTTISNTVDFTVQWVTADVSNAWKANAFTLEALN